MSKTLNVSKSIVFLSLKIILVLANSVDPDEMLHESPVNKG